VRPTWRLLGAVALWLVLEWYGATSEVSWLFLLAAWLLALVVACGAYAWWNRAGLKLHLALERSRPAADSPVEELPEQLLRSGPAVPIFERDGIEMAVGLRTRGSARGPAWISGQIGDQEVRLGTGVVPTKGWTRPQILPDLPRGPIGAMGWTVRSSDPMGFLQSRAASPDLEVALVLPRFTSLVERREARELEASIAAPRAGSGNEIFGIREYRPGDSLRRIHWRSSARHGELVVREYEPPGVQTLGIYLDPAPPSAEVADQIARLAASEAWDCIREGGRVILWAPGLEPSQSPRDLWSQLEWLARYPNSPSGPSSHLPMYGEEVVLIIAGGSPELFEAAEMSRKRRGWIVGDAVFDTEIALRRVGVDWPL